MEIKTFQNTYELFEFHCYIDQVADRECISIVELLLQTDSLDTIEDDFSRIFAVETETQTHVFSNYEVSEYYKLDNGLVKVICIK